MFVCCLPTQLLLEIEAKKLLEMPQKLLSQEIGESVSKQQTKIFLRLALYRKLIELIDACSNIVVLWWRKAEYPEETTDLGWATTTIPGADMDLNPGHSGGK